MEFVVAAVQLTSNADVSRNIDEAEILVNEAATRGARYIQLPEYCNYVGPFRGFARAAETIPGPTTSRMAELARARAVTLHLGSLLEVSPVAGKFYNTSVLIGPTGEISATYRKIHLFDVNVPDAIIFRESDVTAPGNEMVVARLNEFSLGMSVCFDVRFPELYRKLSLAGAEVIAIPAAFNAVTGQAHWELLVRSRAIENHAFVVAAAQVGTTPEGIATYGHSLIVDPWGEILAEAVSDRAEVVLATLELNEVARRRSQIAVMDFLRPDVYDREVRAVD
jgi:predicted amidohydrolase